MKKERLTKRDILQVVLIFITLVVLTGTVMYGAWWYFELTTPEYISVPPYPVDPLEPIPTEAYQPPGIMTEEEYHTWSNRTSQPSEPSFVYEIVDGVEYYALESEYERGFAVAKRPYFYAFWPTIKFDYKKETIGNLGFTVYNPLSTTITMEFGVDGGHTEYIKEFPTKLVLKSGERTMIYYKVVLPPELRQYQWHIYFDYYVGGKFVERIYFRG